MVRIFQALNGSFNSVVADYPESRLSTVNHTSPLQLYKSSLSATFSRQSADFIVKHHLTTVLLQYLTKAECPDEGFWTTLAGSPWTYPMPGSFNAAQFHQKLQSIFGTTAYARGERSFGLYQPEKYYISRFQVWFHHHVPCYGKHVKQSCVFGVRDVPGLLSRPELMVHKFYMDFQPAAYFCMYEAVRRRTHDPNWSFDAKEYGNLPGPRMQRGEDWEKIDVVSPSGLDFY
ncbi:hypothetical protein L596_020538 [Steinernema carpocapsae]|uniref:Uncharacterized protein n=1 Tax=Steinernema carpocapsae TaxID=34508 RepID=A0A4U5MTX2_STECR|nr:hypothetical protein L596_020538 [Steinernema carpocapsae]